MGSKTKSSKQLKEGWKKKEKKKVVTRSKTIHF